MGFRRAAAWVVTDREPHAFGDIGGDECAGMEEEIAFEFRRKLAGLRHLPKRERIHALRAAKLWRVWALKALQEKRRQMSHARRTLRKLKVPVPS